MSGQYITQRQIFCIDSNNRVSGHTSDFGYQLSIDNDVEFDKVVVLEASIPKSYYCVQAGFNSFTLVQDSTNYVITIPAGNYTRTAVCSVLTTLLNAVSSWVYTITYGSMGISGDNGLLTFSVTGNDSQPLFIFNSNSPYQQLGFNIGTYTFTTSSLSSVNVINLAQEGTLFISSNICQTKTDSILCNIFTTQDAGFSYIVYQNPCPYEYSKDFVQSKSNIYQFTLQDENGNIINLNGLNMIFTILLYKSNKIDNLIKGYVKYRTLSLEK